MHACDVGSAQVYFLTNTNRERAVEGELHLAETQEGGRVAGTEPEGESR